MAKEASVLMTLPDECLMRIVNFLPAYEVHRSRLVCRRFSRLTVEASTKRHSLVIYGDVQVGDQFFTDIYDFYRIDGQSIDYRLSSENDTSRGVHLSSSILPLSDLTFATLRAVFRGITVLTIVNNSHSNEWPSKLIGTFSARRLTTLKLINPFITRTSWSLVQKTLCSTLMHHLQHLYISSTTDQLTSLLPFLASISLKTLFIACFHLEDLPQLLRAVEQHLPRLQLFAFRSADIARRLAALDFASTKKKGQQNVDTLSISIQSLLDLQVLVSKWSCLRTLHLCLAQIHETDELPSIAECLCLLQSLDSLTSLKISLCPWYQSNVRLMDPSTMEHLPTLPQLRRVHFKLILDPHLLLTLATCFPFAEVKVEILVNYVRDRQLFRAFCQLCMTHLLNRLLDTEEEDEDQIGQSVIFQLINSTTVHCFER